MSARNRVTVKLLVDVEDETTGDPLWSKGQVLKVDPVSAAAYVADEVAEVVVPEEAEDVPDNVATVSESVSESASAKRKREAAAAEAAAAEAAAAEAAAAAAAGGQ